MNKILMVQILDYQETPPTVAARFWWSTERGVTCDNPRMLARLRKVGILFPELQGMHKVYPADGRAFFDALPVLFRGLRHAQDPVIVEKQEGEAA